MITIYGSKAPGFHDRVLLNPGMYRYYETENSDNYEQAEVTLVKTGCHGMDYCYVSAKSFGRKSADKMINTVMFNSFKNAMNGDPLFKLLNTRCEG